VAVASAGLIWRRKERRQPVLVAVGEER
jgi:hypothetical protein